MKKRQTDPSGILYIAVMILALLITIGIGVWYFKSRQPPKPPVSVAPPVPLPAPDKTPAQPTEQAASSEQSRPEKASPFTYDESDEVFTEVMKRRKSEYGLDESVDMIVKPGESVVVGDETVSMEEVLDKIRIKDGRIVEQDLVPSSGNVRKDRLFTQFKKAKKRYEELETVLGSAESASDPDKLAGALKEREKAGKVIRQFEEYRESAEILDQYKAALAAESPHKEVEALLQKLEQKRESVKEDLFKTLADISGQPTVSLSDEQLAGEGKRLEERLEMVRSQLADAAEQGNTGQIQHLLEEENRLKKAVRQLNTYQHLSERIENLGRIVLLPPDEMASQVQKKADILRIWQSDREDSLAAELLKGEKKSLYGIYLVQPGDNIWNIHFQFLKEYFSHRQVQLSPLSDEPDETGTSSGVGKILKFSENMVYIYNLKDKRLTDNLNLLHPLSKIVIFNMGSALEVLQAIEVNQIKEIRFDGETLWLPAPASDE